jgi:hypothetical protein
VRFDTRNLWIEARPMVDEIDPGRHSLVTQNKSRVRSVRSRATRPAIQSHREQESGKEGYGDDGAPNRGAGAVQHESEYNVRPRGSDSVPAVNVYMAWTNGRESVSPMAFQMRFACPCVDSQCAAQAARQSTPSAGASMKSLLLLSAIALLAACGQSPTAPSTQSGVRPNLLAVPGAISAAVNPSGTGQPSQSCQAEPSQPNGFGTVGFTHATVVYAGSPGTQSAANGNSHAVSQYDVACYQVSNK